MPFGTRYRWQPVIRVHPADALEAIPQRLLLDRQLLAMADVLQRAASAAAEGLAACFYPVRGSLDDIQ